MTIHFANLTRGLLCPHLHGVDVHYTRIQSTQCEGKHWPQVLASAGPDLLMAMALGHEIVVHDVSERDRETRAMWQGLTFIRRTCETVWGLPLTPIPGRGGHAMETYFDTEISWLPRPTRKAIRYYRPHLATRVIRVESCWRSARATAREAGMVAAA
ncbi:hypothetical protein [Nocardia thailandica]|uniref:hypothetical protein n=1 Tax=Nocardia thailandica TaxID=257275 RepID=UPI000318CFCF|nr:hypothetical protein [Nocardia thailandica]